MSEHRAAVAAERIAARGYGIVLAARCEDADTPGFPAQIRGVTDHRRKIVRVSLLANRTMAALADTLEHELRHVDAPEWDCGSRDVLGRGPAIRKGHTAATTHVGFIAGCPDCAAAQEPLSAGLDPGHATPSPAPPEAESGPSAAPWAAGSRPRLSDPQRNALMELCRGRARFGPDWYGGAGWGNVLAALETRRLVRLRRGGAYGGWLAQITELGQRWLEEEGITCR